MPKVQKDKNVTSVIDQLCAREQAGLIKYGTNTERTDLTTLEWLQHLQEELMDGAVYIERLKGDVKETLRLSTVTAVTVQQPDNDADDADDDDDDEDDVDGGKELEEIREIIQSMKKHSTATTTTTTTEDNNNE
tara:strand:+ start:3688 stop:4089 length:402 start_codon:yes stop_codon:yes gene_type:complete